MAPVPPLFAPDPAPLSAAVLVMAESNALALASLVDPMRAANRRAGRTLYRWRYYSEAGGDVPVTAGFAIPTDALPDRADFDVLMIVAGFRLAEQATPALMARLRRLAPQVRAVVSVDGGPGFSALAGLLGRPAGDGALGRPGDLRHALPAHRRGARPLRHLGQDDHCHPGGRDPALT